MKREWEESEMRGGKREKETGESGERGNGVTVNIVLGSNNRTVSYKKLKKFMSPFFFFFFSLRGTLLNY